MQDNDKKFWSLQEFKEAFKAEINKKTHKTSMGGFIDFSKSSDKKSGVYHIVKFADGATYKVLGD